MSSIRWLGAGQSGVRGQLRKGYERNEEMNKIKLIEAGLSLAGGVSTAHTADERDRLVETGMYERGT